MIRALSVVVPVFDEAERIAPNLHRLIAYLDAAFGVQYALVVVDDGSRDDTAHIVAEVARVYDRVRLVRHPVNRGLSAAIRTGVLASDGAHIVTMDADLTYAPPTAGALVD